MGEQVSTSAHHSAQHGLQRSQKSAGTHRLGVLQGGGVLLPGAAGPGACNFAACCVPGTARQPNKSCHTQQAPPRNARTDVGQEGGAEVQGRLQEWLDVVLMGVGQHG